MATPSVAALALDLGTTAIKAGLLDERGNLFNVVSRPAPQVVGAGGRYESDGPAYVRAAEEALDACRAMAGDVPLGLCSQRSSFLIWDRASGLPVTPLISWQDNRGAAACEALRDEEHLIRDLTGLRLAPYYFAPKLRGVLADHPAWRAGIEQGSLLAGTLDAFLIWRWTGGRHFVTDASMAARTLLLDARQARWAPALCGLFNIPISALPEVIPSAGLDIRLDNGLTVRASMGDQSAALIAAVGGSPGASGNAHALVNLGTGGFAMRYLREGEAPQPGYLRTLVYQDSRRHTHAAMEGTLNSLAAALSRYPVAECEVGELARSDIFCLAEPSGLGAPYFRNDLGTQCSVPIQSLPPRTAACLLLEGIIFRVTRMLEEFGQASPLDGIMLSGGLSELQALRQGLALCAPGPVYRMAQRDASLLGAGLAAAGMDAALKAGGRGEAEEIHTEHANPALREKYRRWKCWLDALLKA